MARECISTDVTDVPDAAVDDEAAATARTDGVAVQDWTPRPTVAAAVLGLVAAFALAVPRSALGGATTSYLLVVALAAVAFLPVLARVLAADFEFAEPGIWFAAFYFGHFGVRALYDHYFWSRFFRLFPKYQGVNLINAALVVSLLGLLAFWTGYHTAAPRRVAAALPALPRRWNLASVLPVALACAVAGWAFRVALMTVQAGGVLAWLAADKDALLRGAAGLTYLKLLGSLAVVGLFVLLVHARRTGDRRAWGLFGALLVPELAFRAIGGSRSELAFLLLELLVAYYMTSERRAADGIRLAGWSTSVIGLLVVAFPVLSVVRFQGVGAAAAALRSRPGTLLRPEALFRAVGRRLHDLDSLALIMLKVPESRPHTYGSELLVVAVAWIPRALWPEKPVVSLGRVFREEFVAGLYPPGTSVSVSLVGEFYWDFGVVGVLLGMLAVGALWRVGYEYLVRERGNASKALATGILFTGFFMPVEQAVVSLFTARAFQAFLVVAVALALAPRSPTALVDRAIARWGR